MYDRRWREPTLFRDQFGRIRGWVFISAYLTCVFVAAGVLAAGVLFVRYQIEERDCHRLGERTGMTADYERSGCVLTGPEGIQIGDV